MLLKLMLLVIRCKSKEAFGSFLVLLHEIRIFYDGIWLSPSLYQIIMLLFFFYSFLMMIPCNEMTQKRTSERNIVPSPIIIKNLWNEIWTWFMSTGGMNIIRDERCSREMQKCFEEFIVQLWHLCNISPRTRKLRQIIFKMLSQLLRFIERLGAQKFSSPT